MPESVWRRQNAVLRHMQHRIAHWLPSLTSDHHHCGSGNAPFLLAPGLPTPPPPILAHSQPGLRLRLNDSFDSVLTYVKNRPCFKFPLSPFDSHFFSRHSVLSFFIFFKTKTKKRSWPQNSSASEWNKANQITYHARLLSGSRLSTLRCN